MRVWHSISDTEEDETAHSSRTCPEGKQRVPRPRKRFATIPGILNAAHLDRQLVICHVNVVCLRTAGDHSPPQLPGPESQLLADSGLTRTLASLFLNAVTDALSSKAKPRDQVKHKSVPFWKCTVTPAYCHCRFPACLQGNVTPRPEEAMDLGCHLLLFGPFNIQWFFKS